MATRDELTAAVSARYVRSSRAERGRILDEFTAVTGYHRKHAMRVLRTGQDRQPFGPRPSRRVYDAAVREALVVLWEASDRICGKRLRPMVPVLVESMERHGHLQLAPELRTRLLAMSAATIDRALRDVRGQAGGSANHVHPRPSNNDRSPLFSSIILFPEQWRPPLFRTLWTAACRDFKAQKARPALGAPQSLQSS